MGERIHVYIKDDDLIEWVNEKIKENVFASWSHAVTLALTEKKKRESSEPF